MISNTHSESDAVGGGGHFTRPESPPLPFQLCALLPPLVAGVKRAAVLSRAVAQSDCRAAPTSPNSTAERRVAPQSQRAAHHYAPALHQTRRSPAGSLNHRKEQAVAGRGRIHGPRMIENGETYSVADLGERRAWIVGQS